MNDSLFQANLIPESPSPKIRWMRRHNVKTSKIDDGRWVASKQGETRFAVDYTEMQAIDALSEIHDLPPCPTL